MFLPLKLRPLRTFPLKFLALKFLAPVLLFLISTVPGICVCFQSESFQESFQGERLRAELQAGRKVLEDHACCAGQEGAFARGSSGDRSQDIPQDQSPRGCHDFPFHCLLSQVEEQNFGEPVIFRAAIPLWPSSKNSSPLDLFLLRSAPSTALEEAQSLRFASEPYPSLGEWSFSPFARAPPSSLQA